MANSSFSLSQRTENVLSAVFVFFRPIFMIAPDRFCPRGA
jgi:hypothetical protein